MAATRKDPLDRFSTSLDVALLGTLSPEQRIAGASPATTVKGMFLAPHMAEVGKDWPEIAHKLIAPPRQGHYVPFADYPLADYYRLIFEGSARAFPRVSLPEACRLAARKHMRAFARSTVGSVMLSTITSVEGVLLALPGMFERGSKGIGVEARASGGGVRVEMRGIGGVQDCSAIGTLEGCVMYYGSIPGMDVQIVGPEHAIYDVTWA